MDSYKHLQAILDKVQQREIALFLGAGASHSAGGPSGTKLTEMIKGKFPCINQSLDNFIEVCQDVIDTPPYNRSELEEFIKSVLEPLQPTRLHGIMTKYDWPAIFTTNFDDLIEVAYRISGERLKPCQSIYTESFQVYPSDSSKVFLFKMMGSITATEYESGSMVLSRTDYNRALIRRQKYLAMLFDFVKGGTFVFIGYRFGDRLVLDIIDDVIERYGIDRLPWSYALFDELKGVGEKEHHMFSIRKIIPVECDFDKFFEYLDKNYRISTKKEITKNIHFTYKGHCVEISGTEYRQYAEYFDILDDEKINCDPGEKDEFYMGANESWGAFKEGWDFKRDIYISPNFTRTIGGNKVSGCIRSRVFEELETFDVKENKVLLLKGMAGVGKTMILRRLAYDVYTSGVPTIRINPTQTSLDYKLITSFIEQINHELNKKIPEGKHIPPLKPVILIDDAASHVRHVNRLKDYLTSRGRPALIIAAERSGEWDSVKKEFLFRIPEENIYELNEELMENEKSRIIGHFYDMGYIKTKGTFWDDIISKDFESSYFATIYTLVHPSKKPLNEIIKNQYENLSDITKKAFQYICCFHQFGLPINYELLIRSLNCDEETFRSDVIGRDAAKVIFEERDEIGNILYRTHHRIIARKTRDFFFADPERLNEIFLEIFKKAVLSNRKERELCEKLVVEHIGPNARPQVFSHEQQRQIFRTICEENPVRSLVHHWGVLESDNHNYEEAERLLKWALKIPRIEEESYRGESDRNILTSLGSLYSHRGIDILKQGDSKEAQEYFEKAEESFRDAKHKGVPNCYAYHSHAYMWYLRGKLEKENPEKMNCYAKGLEILSIAKDNINEEEWQPAYELETLIWSEIGDEAKIAQYLDILRDKFKSARGYYLNAELLWRKAHEKEGEERKSILKLALGKVEEGLEFFANDEHCLRLRSKVLRELEPHDLAKYHESLLKWQAATVIPNAWLLYELGRTSFVLRYYDDSKNYFKDLETGVGGGHKLRSRPRCPILDEEGNKQEFEGTIIKIFSLYEGVVRCDSLRSLKYLLGFRPVACKFSASNGDIVKFNISFNYRGPRAENFVKL